MARKREADFDVASIRKLKRLTKRVYTGLVAIERHLVKMERRRQRATPAEAAAALALYRDAAAEGARMLTCSDYGCESGWHAGNCPAWEPAE